MLSRYFVAFGMFAWLFIGLNLLSLIVILVLRIEMVYSVVLGVPLVLANLALRAMGVSAVTSRRSIQHWHNLLGNLGLSILWNFVLFHELEINSILTLDFLVVVVQVFIILMAADLYIRNFAGLTNRVHFRSKLVETLAPYIASLVLAYGFVNLFVFWVQSME